ncbi:hypothetical protein HIU56_12205 [Enterococcus faecium]|uniref:hypothetical protein n=1 Tax=Enterococcus faecium TaxID=1352 RepID=UPI001C446404|nr:hypothetical protein [Enterococcus faecium]
MKYSIQQIDEIKETILAIKFKKEELEDLEVEVLEITDSTKETYSLTFYYSREERVFNIPALSLIDHYNANITNLKLEIISLEKRLQELVK